MCSFSTFLFNFVIKEISTSKFIILFIHCIDSSGLLIPGLCDHVRRSFNWLNYRCKTVSCLQMFEVSFFVWRRWTFRKERLFNQWMELNSEIINYYIYNYYLMCSSAWAGCVGVWRQRKTDFRSSEFLPVTLPRCNAFPTRSSRVRRIQGELRTLKKKNI